ncbi:UNVERIFIED_CONTAM: hypothetical protein O8I53_08420 [Campylobacter lari]
MKFKEENNTKVDFDYLVGFEVRDKVKPFEAISADFMIIKNNNKHKHLHMIVDINSHKILSFNISDNQTSEVVMKDLKKLINVKIINTDHGR